MSSIASTPSASLLAPDARLAARARSGDTRALAYEAAKTLVTEGLVKPVFAQLREGGFAAEGFAPGTAERRFRPMFDAILADRVVEGSNFALVERTADRFERSMARRSEVAAHAVARRGGPR
ncbi:MAG: hypothetical protein RL354_1443 [Planctomycetota bacterium]|jgi:hypothetical protein